MLGDDLPSPRRLRAVKAQAMVGTFLIGHASDAFLTVSLWLGNVGDRMLRDASLTMARQGYIDRLRERLARGLGG